MANLAYFEIAADDIRRAMRFYTSVLGWKIEPTKTPGMSMEYYDVTTGEPREGTLNSGGMYRRMEPDTPIIAYAMVDDMDAVLKKVEKHGGKIHRPKMEIPNVGWIAIISDTEGNTIGIWKPGMPPGNH